MYILLSKFDCLCGWLVENEFSRHRSQHFYENLISISYFMVYKRASCNSSYLIWGNYSARTFSISLV